MDYPLPTKAVVQPSRDTAIAFHPSVEPTHLPMSQLSAHTEPISQAHCWI